MPEKSEICANRAKLESRVRDTLQKLAALAAQEGDLISSGDQPKIDAVDSEIESVLGDKERAIGALKQHRSEHGC